MVMLILNKIYVSWNNRHLQLLYDLSEMVVSSEQTSMNYIYYFKKSEPLKSKLKFSTIAII